jgi:hypothetical protein
LENACGKTRRPPFQGGKSACVKEKTTNRGREKKEEHVRGKQRRTKKRRYKGMW